MIDPNYLPFILAAGGVVLLAVFFHYVPFFLWLSAKVSGVRISLVQLFLMRIRNVPPYVIVPAMIEAHKAGLSTITRDELEAHYMAGGHVEKVVHALVSASKANIDLSFQMATGIDLAGRDGPLLQSGKSSILKSIRTRSFGREKRFFSYPEIRREFYEPHCAHRGVRCRRFCRFRVRPGACRAECHALWPH